MSSLTDQTLSPTSSGAGGRRRLFVYGILTAFTILVALLGFRLVGEVRSIQAAPRDNVQWMLSQVEVDLLRLNRAFRRAADGEASLSDVRKRYDLFFSRIDILQEGDAFEDLRASELASQQLKTIRGFLNQTVILIDGPDEELTANLGRLATTSDTLTEPIRDLSLTGVRLYATASDEQRAGFTGTLMIAIYVSIGLILLLGLSMAFLERQSRISLHRAKESDRARRRQAATVNASLDAIVVADGNGRVIDWNDAASELFGYSRDHAIGSEMAELIVPESLRDAHREGMERFLKTGVKHVVDSGRLELTAMRVDGSEFPVEISIALADQQDGPVFVSYLRDIAARQAAEMAMTQARDAAMAADKAKSEFLAVMSHEMRTPLNGVLGVLDLLDNTTLKPRQKRYVAAAMNSGEILLRHINDVLDITRIEADRMTFESVPVDLVNLLSEAVDVTKPIAEANGNEISISADLADSAYLADAHRLRQVFLNLLGNAAKFTENGKIVTGIRVLESAGKTDWLEFAVNDSGAGIAPGDREKIFEDFVTLDPSYDRKTSGSGLGLAISRRIVNAMGGSMGVGSSILGGARFWFKMPLEKTKLLKAAVEVTSEPQTAGNARVLVVEDNPLNRMIVREMLEQAGHHVTEVEDGQEGVSAAETERFDVILMDVSMPVMDGVTATRTIKSGDGPSKLATIVGLTAHALPDELRRFEQAGMERCLVKPVRRADLLRVVGINSSIGRDPLVELASDWDVIDTEVLAELGATLSKSKLGETISRAIDDLQAGLARLGDLPPDAPDPEIASIAHKLAGTAAIVGATAVRERLIQIEQSALDAKEVELDTHLPLLSASIETVSAILREYISDEN